MKKILLTLAAFAGLYANAQQRLVLYEEFTGENCPPCAATNPGLLTLMEAGTNPSKILMIKYQSPIPSAGPIYNQNKTQVNDRLTYYKISSAPQGYMDGKPGSSQGAHPAYMTQTIINAGAAVPSAFTIGAVANYNSAKDSITIDITITAVSDYTPAKAAGKIKLRTALLETLHYTKAPGTNGEKDFENVVRYMYPNTSGTALPDSWTAGESHTYTISGLVPTYVDETKNPSVAVWIQNDSNKKVEQAGISHITWPTAVSNVNKAVVTDVTVYPNPTKDNATVSVTLANAGEVVITLVDAAGRVISTTPNTGNAGTQQYTINTSALASGLYYVCVQTADGLTTKQLSVTK